MRYSGQSSTLYLYNASVHIYLRYIFTIITHDTLFMLQKINENAYNVVIGTCYVKLYNINVM